MERRGTPHLSSKSDGRAYGARSAVPPGLVPGDTRLDSAGTTERCCGRAGTRLAATPDHRNPYPKLTFHRRVDPLYVLSGTVLSALVVHVAIYQLRLTVCR